MRLVDPAWLERQLAQPAEIGDGQRAWVLLEIGFPSETPLKEPEPEGSVPGAIALHPSYFEAGLDSSRYYPRYTCPEDGNLLPDDELQGVIDATGIAEGTTVIVYGRGGAATMAACRAVWALAYAGVSDLCMLDGGIAAWVRHGGKVSHPPLAPSSMPAPRGAPGGGRCCRPEFLATTAEVAAVVARSAPGLLVDVRRLAEHDGSMADAYKFFGGGGCIEGSIHQGDWHVLVDPCTGKLVQPEDARRRWLEIGLDGDAEGRPPLIFYCGTGWRSSIGWVLAHLLGWNAKNYDDGWYGWSAAAQSPGRGAA